MKPFIFSTVPDTHVGANSIVQLGTIAKNMGLEKVLLVTDPGIQAAGLLEKGIQSLAEAKINLSLFAKVQSDPADSIIELAYDQYKEQDCDAVIGLGGGSSMDVAKVVAVLAMEQQTLS